MRSKISRVVNKVGELKSFKPISMVLLFVSTILSVRQRAIDKFISAGRKASRNKYTRGLFVLPLAYSLFVTQTYAFEVCELDIVDVLSNIYSLIFQVGPILALIAAAVSFTMMSVTKSADKKKQWREYRNDALLWGVLGLLSLNMIINVLMGVADVEADCLDGIL